MVRRLFSCCMKPKRDTEEGEDIEITRITRPTAKTSRTEDAPSECLAAREPTLPVKTPAPPSKPEPIASSSNNPAYARNGVVHPALMSESLATSSNPSSDPDEISAYAGSAPMYRNVKNAAEDRKLLLQRLRNPQMAPPQLQDTTPTIMNGKQCAEAEGDGGGDHHTDPPVQGNKHDEAQI